MEESAGEGRPNGNRTTEIKEGDIGIGGSNGIFET